MKSPNFDLSDENLKKAEQQMLNDFNKFYNNRQKVINEENEMAQHIIKTWLKPFGLKGKIIKCTKRKD